MATYVDPTVSLVVIADYLRNASPQSPAADKLDRLAGRLKALRAREGRALSFARLGDRPAIEQMIADQGVPRVIGEVARDLEALVNRSNVQEWNGLSEDLLSLANRLG
jgi:hypothetical protein